MRIEIRPSRSLLLATLCAWTLAAAPLPAASQVVDPGTSVEACISCHSPASYAPVFDVEDPSDVHYVDLDPDGPETPSSYRQVNVAIGSVDLSGSQVVIDFQATNEDGLAITNLFDSDGRFAIARLVLGAVAGDPTEWQTILSSESFTEAGGSFQNLGGGSYRYVSVFDPTSVPIVAGETLRVAIQISADDIPAGNGWCDFDANTSSPNGCAGPVAVTRDIVQTANCNGCHGATNDTKLAFHGGGRTEVEYCVVCHNPGLGDADMTNMVHKIHYGENLSQGYGDYSDVIFTRDVDNCLACHGGGGVDEDNWKAVPNFAACESCHDDLDIANGVGHIAIPSNGFCMNCHPADGPVTPSLFPVATVHQGVARAQEGALYRGGSNGFSIDAADFDRDTSQLTVDYSVTRDGSKMILQSDPRWTNGGGLSLLVGWTTEEYTNEGGGSTPAPAQPRSFDALDIGNTVADLGGGSYRRVIDVSSFGFGNLTVGLEGHPVADLLGDGTYSDVPVRDVVETVNIEIREDTLPRREVVDIAKCNLCHDSGGAGLAFHGNNRTSEDQVCVLCHNPDATDIRRRPADPMSTPDGKREESIDFKRMIHGIHAGSDLENGLVVYGFGNSAHDYSGVDFIGNNANCLTCHLPGTYGVDAAVETLGSTVDTGADVTIAEDDLNISPVAAVCSSCHDDAVAVNHMILGGASFIALDEDILPVPEPGFGLALPIGCGALALAAGRRRRAKR